MKELLPGLYQLTITLKGFSPNSVNAYLLRDVDYYTVIDTGWDAPDSVESMKAQLKESGIRFSDIKKVLLTHCHSDHLGMIGRFKELNNALIYIHRNELDLIRVRYNAENNYWPNTDLYLKSHGMPDSELNPEDFTMPDMGALIPPDILLSGGEEITVGEYSLKVINTPGHTPGHVSFYEPRRKLLFSGDVLLPTIVTNAAGHIQHMVNPLQQYFNSLNTLKPLDIEFVLPGHEYIFSDHRKRIKEIEAVYRQKKESILRVLKIKRQPLTAYDVARHLTWTPRLRTITFAELRGHDKRFAVFQTIALLEELAYSGQVIRLPQPGLTQYQVKE
jgi:glyoxylase-like metal-dependent hydrolase (beta-lactamase superfamily II)